MRASRVVESMRHSSSKRAGGKSCAKPGVSLLCASLDAVPSFAVSAPQKYLSKSPARYSFQE